MRYVGCVLGRYVRKTGLFGVSGNDKSSRANSITDDPYKHVYH